jgi:CHASE2 domain-containing sensor protein
MNQPSPAAAPATRLDWLDTALVSLFLLGLYLGVALQISSGVPLTCAPSGVAGLIMLWRRRDQINPRHLAGLLAVVTVYLCSILAASDYAYLGKRFTGLLQLTYSLVIGYAIFLTLVHGERRQIAGILLGFCIFIIVGCLLETYAGLRPISDAVRDRLYDSGVVYDANLRDQILYGRIRPKLFTSEPSAVTFAYTHYCSVWLVVSTWRWKLPVYLGMIGMALFVLPGPTLVLMLLLTVPYLIFLAGAQAGRRPSTMRAAASILRVGARQPRAAPAPVPAFAPARPQLRFINPAGYLRT